MPGLWRWVLALAKREGRTLSPTFPMFPANVGLTSDLHTPFFLGGPEPRALSAHTSE
jgi:hypothetical protein